MRALPLAIVFVILLVLAGCGSEKSKVMPDVVGRQLDVALNEIKRAGVPQEVEVLGGGVLGIVDKSNWRVCEQEPPAGQVIKAAPRAKGGSLLHHRHLRVSGDTVPRANQQVAGEPGSANGQRIGY